METTEVVKTSQSPQVFVEKTSFVDETANLIPPQLNEYLDYRLFLKDFYSFKRKTHKGLRPYSYSVFSAACDIKSPNYLKLIIESKRNLSSEMAGKFAKGLKLSKSESEEFRLLVEYGQELDPLKRNQALRDLADLRVRQKIEVGEIEKENWEKVPGWVTWVLYTMADQSGVEFEPEKLKKLFRRNTSIDELKLALKKLFELGQFEFDENGKVKKVRELIEDITAVPVALVRKLQAELNYLGMESLFEDSPKEREFGALTVSLTQEEFEKIRFELRQLRKRIHKEIFVNREKSEGDRVYQMNLQLFPLTDKSE